MIRWAILVLAACRRDGPPLPTPRPHVEAKAPGSLDMEPAWEHWWPHSRTAQLDDRAQVALPPHADLVGVDDRGAVLDDGTQVWRASHGAVHELRSSQRPIGELVWARAGGLVGLDASDGVVRIAPSLPPGQPRAVRLADALYYTTADHLARYQLSTQVATDLAPLGRDYGGALASDGRDVYVADREAIWRWDTVAQVRREVSYEVYWPGDLAVRGTAILADVHGHGAVVIDATEQTGLGTLSSLWPTGPLGWLDDNAIFVGETMMLTSADDVRTWGAGESLPSSANADYLGGGQAIFCWRSERTAPDDDGVRSARLHRLYQSAPGIEICQLRASGKSLAWIEASRTGGCHDAIHAVVVTVTLRGACE